MQDASLHWVSIDTRSAALTFGSEIIARILFNDADTILVDRRDPSVRISKVTLSPDTNSVSLPESTIIRLDDSCSISIDGLATHIVAPELSTQSAAWLILGNDQDDDPISSELAATLSTQAFLVLANSTCCESVLLQIGAIAIERLLDADNVDLANSIYTTLASTPWRMVPMGNPSRIRFSIATARLLSFLDNCEEALNRRLSQRALTASTFGIASDEYLDNELRIANLRLELGDYHAARSALENIFADVRAERSINDPIFFRTVLALSNAFALLGLDRESLEFLVDFKHDLENLIGGDSRKVSNLRNQIARVRVRLGQLELASQDVAETYIWQRKFLNSERREFMETTWLLGQIFKDLGRLSTARALIYSVLDQIDRQQLLAARKLQLKALGTLASIEAVEGNLGAAEEIWKDVADQYLGRPDSNSEEAIGARMNLELHAILNGKMDVACNSWKIQSHDWQPQLHLNGHLEAFSNILSGFCKISLSGAASIAESGLRQLDSALTSLQKLDGPDSDSVMFTLSLLARANLHHGDRGRAKEFLRLLVSKAETRRASTAEGSLTRESWLSKWISERSNLIGYRRLALLLAEDGEIEDSLRVSDLSRGRLLFDRYDRRLPKCEILREDTSGTYGRISDEIENLEETIANSEDILLKVELESKRILAVRARTVMLKTSAEAQDCNEHSRFLRQNALQFDLIPASTAVISVQHSGSKWWAIIATANQPLHIIWLKSDQELGRLAQAWLYALRHESIHAWTIEGGDIVLSYSRPDNAVGRPWSEHDLRTALSRLFLSPILKAVPGVKNFVFVADDDFVELPLGLLSHANGFAVEDVVFGLAPSVAAYIEGIRVRSRLHWEKDLLAFATSESTPGVHAQKESLTSEPSAKPFGVFAKSGADVPLKFAVPEVMQIAENFLSSRTSLFIGPSASKSSLFSVNRDGSLQKFRFVHFALHFRSAVYAPDASRLIFDAPEPMPSIDYEVTAAEISNLRMASELVVFSGCSTAVGPYEPGQGLLGLAYAAIAAGNSTTLLTLWQVSDELAQRFMVRFYQSLGGGLTPSESLALTQRSFILGSDVRMRDPGIWAAFVIIGSD
jgi:CHAT domain-containing protein